MEKQNCAISTGDDSKPPKVKLMCSYGGKIQPRPHDHHLTYAGGDTKILAVDRRVTFPDILAKLTSLLSGENDAVSSFKYQLPGEDLDALVSVVDGDDLEHMMAEYDRLSHCASPKPARLRIFLFSSENRTETKAAASTSPPPLNPDFLFGFDKEYEYDNYQITRPVQESDLPRGAGRSDYFAGSEMNIQPQIQGIPFSRQNSHVVYGIPPGYQGGGPVPYGLTAVRMVPVYGHFPAMSGAPAGMKNGVGAEGRGHVAGEEGGRSEVYNGMSPHQIGE